MNIDELRGKKFAASYSGGKDSILAIYRARESGLIPAELITTYNTDAHRSWFHGMNDTLLEKVREKLAIPLTLVRTTGERYEENFEKALIGAKEKGVQAAVFGDIDIDGHLEWCTARCEKTGLIPYFPLWKESRKALVYEFIDSGFSAVITCVDTERLSADFLGLTLSRGVADDIERAGADICGENGEFHTFVYDGPLFAGRIDFKVKGKANQGKHAVLDIE